MRYTQADGSQVKADGEPHTDSKGRTVWLKQVPADAPDELSTGTLNGVNYLITNAAVSIELEDGSVMGGNAGDWLLYDGENLTVISESAKASNYTSGGVA